MQHLSTGINHFSKICHLTPPPQVLLQLLHVPQLAQEEGTGTKLRKSLMAKEIRVVVREMVKYFFLIFPANDVPPVQICFAKMYLSPPQKKLLAPKVLLDYLRPMIAIQPVRRVASFVPSYHPGWEHVE